VQNTILAALDKQGPMFAPGTNLKGMAIHHHGRNRFYSDFAQPAPTSDLDQRRGRRCRWLQSTTPRATLALKELSSVLWGN